MPSTLARDRSGKGCSANDSAGHRKLDPTPHALEGHGSHVCVEATGIYHLDLCLALDASEGHRGHGREPACHQGLRTRSAAAVEDGPHGCSVAARVRASDGLRVVGAPAPSRSWAYGLSRGESRPFLVTRAQEKNRLHADESVEQTPAAIRESIDRHIEALSAEIDALTEAALEVVHADGTLESRFCHLVSVKGIAQASAITLLAELSVLPSDMSTRQWVAHAGIDPRHYESGTSVHAAVRISKVGNRHLRAALFLPAMVASQHEPQVRAYYQKLLAKGKKPMQALVAVMRKLLHAIHGMFEHDADFDGTKFFAEKA